jgi:6,7-dimethyl-8-ribityllumazine synthase
MPRTIEGNRDASHFRFAIVASRFNEDVVKGLLDGALDALTRNNVDDSAISVYRCPGAFEIPTVARALCSSGRYNAVIALGCLLKGDTLHFEVLSYQVTLELSRVSVETQVPVAFGVLTCNTQEQADARSGRGDGNKGFEAAEAAIEMASLWRALRTSGQ